MIEFRRTTFAYVSAATPKTNSSSVNQTIMIRKPTKSSTVTYEVESLICLALQDLFLIRKQTIITGALSIPISLVVTTNGRKGIIKPGNKSFRTIIIINWGSFISVLTISVFPLLFEKKPDIGGWPQMNLQRVATGLSNFISGRPEE